MRFDRHVTPSVADTSKLNHCFGFLSPLSQAVSLPNRKSRKGYEKLAFARPFHDSCRHGLAGSLLVSRCTGTWQGRRGKRMTDEEEKVLIAKLAHLREEHRDLDAAIAALTQGLGDDQLRLSRMKKRKLQLRDEIAQIEDVFLPDIIA